MADKGAKDDCPTCKGSAEGCRDCYDTCGTYESIRNGVPIRYSLDDTEYSRRIVKLLHRMIGLQCERLDKMWEDEN